MMGVCLKRAKCEFYSLIHTPDSGSINRSQSDNAFGFTLHRSFRRLCQVHMVMHAMIAGQPASVRIHRTTRRSCFALPNVGTKNSELIPQPSKTIPI
jgi:hypothetical protein